MGCLRVERLLSEIRAANVGFSYCYRIEFAGSYAMVRKLHLKGTKPTVDEDTCRVDRSNAESDRPANFQHYVESNIHLCVNRTNTC